MRTRLPLVPWLLAAGALHGCATVPTAAGTAVYAADGVHLRHVRLRVAPAQTQDFEALMERCVAVATESELPSEWDWLCYLEPPGRYWLLTFADEPDRFPIPDSSEPLRTFVHALADHADPATRRALVGALEALEYELEWQLVARQKRAWSTVEEMATSEHPMARLMVRTVRPGAEAAFERALAERTAFLVERGYPLPVEGFVVRSGWPGTALQVVFPRDWPSFHARESFWQFSLHLPDDQRAAYLQRKDALMRTMASAEYYDGKVRPDASYAGR